MACKGLWLAAALVFNVHPAPPSAQLNIFKVKLQTNIEKKSLSRKPLLIVKKKIKIYSSAGIETDVSGCLVLSVRQFFAIQFDIKIHFSP